MVAVILTMKNISKEYASRRNLMLFWQRSHILSIMTSLKMGFPDSPESRHELSLIVVVGREGDSD